jgi:hypothetical protein
MLQIFIVDNQACELLSSISFFVAHSPIPSYGLFMNLWLKFLFVKTPHPRLKWCTALLYAANSTVCII